MESAPQDHRLYSNRALCYLAVEDWPKARDDAQYCARLRPDFKKAWLLLTKALWKMGRIEEASDQLQQGLRYLPSCPELLELQVDFTKEIGEASFRTASRSVSPCYTPPPSRNTTPPRGTPFKGTPPSATQGHRPVSPPLLAAGRSAGGIGAAQTYGGPSSRSPGPRARPTPPTSRSPGPANRSKAGNVTLDASFGTGNFGAPTPCFAASSQQPSMQAAFQSSFPTNAQTMWAGDAGGASHRSSYSPGPAAAASVPNTSRSTHSAHTGPGTARSNHSPGPAYRNENDFEASGRGPGSLRKSSSLRGMMESSTRSRDHTPNSRGPTPPRR